MFCDLSAIYDISNVQFPCRCRFPDCSCADKKRVGAIGIALSTAFRHGNGLFDRSRSDVAEADVSAHGAFVLAVAAPFRFVNGKRTSGGEWFVDFMFQGTGEGFRSFSGSFRTSVARRLVRTDVSIRRPSGLVGLSQSLQSGLGIEFRRRVGRRRDPGEHRDGPSFCRMVSG